MQWNKTRRAVKVAVSTEGFMSEVRKFWYEVQIRLLVGDPNFRLLKWQQILYLINMHELKDAVN